MAKRIVFEKIVLRNSENQPGITPGDLAESLLFYQKVHVVLDINSFKFILDGIGMDRLLSLIRKKRITAYYAEDMLMTRNENQGSRQLHWFDSGSVSGKPGDEKPRKGNKGRLAMLLEMNGSTPRSAQKLSDQFLEFAHMGRLSSDHFVKGGIPAGAMSDLSNPEYVHACIRTVLKNTVGFDGYANNLVLEISPVGNKFIVQTNIDFNQGNALRKSIASALEPISEGNLLNGILSARADISLAAFYGGDFRTSAAISEIIQIRHAELLRRTGINADEISNFHSVELSNYPTIRDVINNKGRSFDEFLKLLDISDKFRDMVHRIEPDAKLVAEYVAEIKKEGWISSVDAKTVRYLIVAAVAFKNETAGFAAAWADLFLTEKILAPWRPNHFVDGKLKPFLDKEASAR
jgi:hypothetical protein